MCHSPKKKHISSIYEITAAQSSSMINELYNRHTSFFLMVSRTKNMAVIIHAVYILEKHGVQLM